VTGFPGRPWHTGPVEATNQRAVAMSGRSLVEEVISDNYSGAGQGAEQPSADEKNPEGVIQPDGAASASPEAVRSEAPDRQAGSAAQYLEVGHTIRPKGHSLRCQPGQMPPFAPPTVPTALLDKLNSFLPQLELANAALQEEMRKDPTASARFDVNNVDGEDESKVVTMDLAVVPAELLAEESEDEGRDDPKE